MFLKMSICQVLYTRFMVPCAALQCDENNEVGQDVVSKNGFRAFWSLTEILAIRKEKDSYSIFPLNREYQRLQFIEISKM